MEASSRRRSASPPRRPRRRPALRAAPWLASGAIAVLLGAACGTALEPSPSQAASVPTSGSIGTAPPDAGAVLLRNMVGPFRSKFVPVADEIAAVVRRACIAAADPVLSFGLTDQPVAVADARGLGLVSVILADDAAAFECRATLADDGTSATTIEPPSRLDPGGTDALDGDAISRVSQTVVRDPSGQRTIAFGRVGPDGLEVGVEFNDETEVVAAVANGWWAAWWPGIKDPGGIVSANHRNEVLNHVPDPTRLVEGRVTPAPWWVATEPKPIAMTVRATMVERTCSGGNSPRGRLATPTIATSKASVVVTVWIRRPDPGDCLANPEFPLVIQLPEPLGTGRTLRDGSETPPRDATIHPA